MQPISMQSRSSMFMGNISHAKLYRIAVLISQRSKGYASPEDQRMSDHYLEDDAILAQTFKQYNLIYEEVIWDKPNINWTEYDGVLIRSTWDYHEGKLNQFLKTLKSIENAGIPLFNSYKTVYWNCKKTYLKELQEIGLPIIETLFVSKKDVSNIEPLLQEKKWKQYILKPAVSAGAHRTFKVSDSAQAQNIYLSQYDENETVLIQPFAEEIVNEGEWSFIFLNGQYSHSVLKKPPMDDFRVQLFFGNQDKAQVWMIEQASLIFKNLQMLIGEIPLYVRIDTINRNNRLHIMEVELIEPYLYLQTSADAAQKLTQALLKRINTSARAHLAL